LVKKRVPVGVAATAWNGRQIEASMVGVGVGDTIGVVRGLAYATAAKPGGGANGSGILASNVTNASASVVNTLTGKSRRNPDR